MVFSLLATCLAGVGIYNRYFDAAGGALCPLQHEPVQIRKTKICHWNGYSMEVITHRLPDVRYTGDRHMFLIKYTGGIAYQCFWFDQREFDYWIDGLESSSVGSGCQDNQRNLIMIRKLKHD